MKVSIHEERTVGEIREAIRERYGSVADLRAHVEDHPDDLQARIDLHDLREYRDAPPTRRVRQRRIVVVPDDRIDELTVRRLQLLLSLKRLGGRAESIRRLADAVGRDVKNVSRDVEALDELGLLAVDRQGPGRPHAVALPGQRVDLHLVEAAP